MRLVKQPILQLHTLADIRLKQSFGMQVVTINSTLTWQLRLANNINTISDVWFTEHEYPFLKSVRVVL
jgi:uncharacterized protein with PhoU and TrkA domain